MECNVCKKQYDFCKYHHIESKCYGGTDNSINRTYLCDKCHELVHYGLIILEGNFSSTKGIVLVWRKLNQKSITDTKDPKVWLKPNHKKIQETYTRRKQNEQNIRKN